MLNTPENNKEALKILHGLYYKIIEEVKEIQFKRKNNKIKAWQKTLKVIKVKKA